MTDDTGHRSMSFFLLPPMSSSLFEGPLFPFSSRCLLEFQCFAATGDFFGVGPAVFPPHRSSFSLPPVPVQVDSFSFAFSVLEEIGIHSSVVQKHGKSPLANLFYRGNFLFSYRTPPSLPRGPTIRTARLKISLRFSPLLSLFLPWDLTHLLYAPLQESDGRISSHPK